MAASPLFIELSRPERSGALFQTVSVTLNGQPMRLRADVPLAAALLAAGIKRFRNSPVSGSARAPYCMMGVCYECLVEIDDVPSQQACLIRPREGMHIRTMDGLPTSMFADATPEAQPGAATGDRQ